MTIRAAELLRVASTQSATLTAMGARCPVRLISVEARTVKLTIDISHGVGVNGIQPGSQVEVEFYDRHRHYWFASEVIPDDEEVTAIRPMAMKYMVIRVSMPDTIESRMRTPQKPESTGISPWVAFLAIAALIIIGIWQVL